MRRGNFAFYSKDKPLFGRITGLVWRPPMIVNAGNTNETKSSYVVNP